MSVDTTAAYDQGNLACDEIAADDYREEALYVDQINAEHQLWDLQRELNQCKLALQAEIWDLRAEVQDLRFNAIVLAGDLSKLVGKMLRFNAPNPDDPNC